MAAKKYVVLKNFINTDYFLQIAKHDEASPSKIGKLVDPTKKRRMDQVFSDEVISNIDSIIYRKSKKIIYDYFQIHIGYREPWKIGFYSSEDQGYYNQHTDTQGNFDHRRISMSICLTDRSEYKGGLLRFPNLNQELRLNKGDACFFRSSLLHEVTPVTEGSRAVLIGFFITKLPPVDSVLNNTILSHPRMNYKPNSHMAKKENESETRYLLPITPDSGPGNQIISIKEALIIAYFLNRQIIFPAIAQHYTKEQKYWGFSEIFRYGDHPIMEYYDYQPSKSDLSKTQYSCSSTYADKPLKQQSFLGLAKTTFEPLSIRRFESIEDFSCELGNVSTKCLILKHPYNSVKLQTQEVNGIFGDPYNLQFESIYRNICQKLDFSSYIKQQAKDFMKRSGIYKKEFIAVHLRYPDKIEKNTTLNDFAKFSENDLDNALKRNFGKHYNLFFIATNNQTLAKSGPLGKYIFYDDAANSKTSFIEQYIAANASIFVLSTTNDYKESKRSSWSSFVLEYRIFNLEIEPRFHKSIDEIIRF